MRRYTGEVPIFGGSPATGLREISSAAATSVTGSAALARAAETFATALRGVSSGSAVIDDSPTRSGPGSIVMIDHTYGQLQDAADIDDERLRLMLSVSAVRPHDTDRYLNLLRIARDGLLKKAAAISNQRERKAAKISYQPVANDSDMTLALDGARQLVESMREGLFLDFVSPDADSLLLRAITHESFVAGRETNRVLAHVGDSVARLACGLFAMRTPDMTVSDISDMVQSDQNNAAFREMALKVGLHHWIRAAPGTDVTAKGILSTAFEALIGVAFYDGGMDSVMKLNAVFGFVKNPA